VRTTVTLEADVEQILRRRMRERNQSFKEALNDAIRAGTSNDAAPFRTATASMGEPTVNLDRALQIVGELEDDELVRKMRSGS
jgi:adenylate kinase